MLWTERTKPAALPTAIATTGPPINTPPSLAEAKPLDLEKLRARLHKMTDAQLVAFGKFAAFACANSPQAVFLIELEESQNEWRRRKTVLLGLTVD